MYSCLCTTTGYLCMHCKANLIESPLYNESTTGILKPYGSEIRIMVETFTDASRAGFSGENIVKYSRRVCRWHSTPMFAEPEELWVDSCTRTCVIHTQKWECIYKVTYFPQVLEIFTRIFFSYVDYINRVESHFLSWY